LGRQITKIEPRGGKNLQQKNTSEEHIFFFLFLRRYKTQRKTWRGFKEEQKKSVEIRKSRKGRAKKNKRKICKKRPSTRAGGVAKHVS